VSYSDRDTGAGLAGPLGEPLDPGTSRLTSERRLLRRVTIAGVPPG
jgi:hypothetical protein